MLSIRQEAPIDQTLHEVLSHVRDVAAGLDVDFFVGGAMARDILLTHVHGIPQSRATRDVDLGVYVKEWAVFLELKKRLVEKARFKDAPGELQRLHFQGTPLDLIPFGGVSEDGATISWPPKHDEIMNIVGFEEAFEASIMVDLGHDLVVRTCTLPSLAVLKLVAWKDRHNQSNKDANDFLLIAERYGEPLNQDRLWETESTLLGQVDHSFLRAGAHLLGKDCAGLCRPESRQQILSIFNDPRLRQLLIDQLVRIKAGSLDEYMEDKIAQVIDDFLAGFGHGPS